MHLALILTTGEVLLAASQLIKLQELQLQKENAEIAQRFADCMAVQTFIGSAGESRSLRLLGEAVDAGTKYGIPTLGVVGVGKDMDRSEKFG